MRAFQLAAASLKDARRALSIALASDSAAPAQWLMTALAQSALFAPSFVFNDVLADLGTRRAPLRTDLVVVLVGKSHSSAAAAALDELARAHPVLVIASRAAFRRFEGAQSWRTYGFLDRRDATPGALDSTIAGLLRARRNEDRVVRSLGEIAEQLREFRDAAARIDSAIEATLETSARFSGHVARIALGGAAARAAALSFDAVDGLALARQEFARDIAPRRPAPAATVDLNEVVDSYVRGQSETPNELSALTSANPIPVAVDAAALRAMLDTVLAAWRRMRSPADKLEILTWDAGARAKLAAIIHRPIAGHGSDRASAFMFARNLCRDLHPAAEACGAAVDADGGSAGGPRSVVTLCLPKMSSGGGRRWRARAAPASPPRAVPAF